MVLSKPALRFTIVVISAVFLSGVLAVAGFPQTAARPRLTPAVLLFKPIPASRPRFASGPHLNSRATCAAKGYESKPVNDFSRVKRFDPAGPAAKESSRGGESLFTGQPFNSANGSVKSAAFASASHL